MYLYCVELNMRFAKKILYYLMKEEPLYYYFIFVRVFLSRAGSVR